MAGEASGVDTFADLEFRHPLRRYQRFALAHVDDAVRDGGHDGRFHLVAPPGSGKTILGIELARRFGRPTVVFAPTTAIVEQWRARVAMFLPDGADLDRYVSTDPARLAPLTVLTYQVASTTASAEPLVQQAAREAWIDHLVDDGATPEDAEGRLSTLHANNRAAYDRELSRRTRRQKRQLLADGDADIRRFLHANAVDLLDRLVAHGVGTVVLDECHHLLDHWAVVLRALIDDLDGPRVVGLTATLPDPDSPTEFENYHALLGDVDVEVPTPAVVKEGELAPYRDNVWFVEPTVAEHAYLDDIEGAFERAVETITTRDGFTRWLVGPLHDPKAGEEPAARLATLLRDDPVVGLARLRIAHASGIDLGDVPVPLDAHQPPTADERARVVAAYALDHLAVSEDPADHAAVDELRAALRPFGFTLTERGLRQIRSPGDLVLAYSEAKQHAAADILELEAAALGERLRAIVVTDFERTGRGVATVGEALAADAGSARRVFHTLIERTALVDLDPVLVTGRTVWVAATVADLLLDFARDWFAREGRDAELTVTDGEVPGALALNGVGRDWSTRTYVAMLTAAFEEGITRCLVGTRGLFGEGWDALRLNTLIDLTSVTTAQSVQQLRGRSLRLDPSWSHKVAHNWDVVCVDTGHAHGDRDLRRLDRRHRRFWGIAELSGTAKVFDGASIAPSFQPEGTPAIAGSSLHGTIVRGLTHVDVPLLDQLATREWWKVGFERATKRSKQRIGDRDDSWQLWDVGGPYDDARAWTSDLRLRQTDLRPVATISGLVRELLAALRSALIGTAALLATQATAAVGQARGPWLLSLTVLLAVVVVGSLVANRRTIGRVGRALLRELPADAIVGDVGRAVAQGLRDVELISPEISIDQVRVAVDDRDVTSLLLEHASAEDTEVFVTACEQVLGPVVDPRYLVVRDDRRLPDAGARWLWVPLRTALSRRFGPPVAHHPVPDVLGVNRQRADAFAKAWERHVGGGELVHTRSDHGWQILLEARAAQPAVATCLTYERWS